MGSAAQPIRLVLVDDHEIVRTGVKAEVSQAYTPSGKKITVVAQADDVEGAIDVISATKPDVVLLDVHLPGGNGTAVIEGVKKAGIETRFLALSVSDSRDDVIAVIRAGARGYVTKAIAAEELISAIDRVSDGEAVFSPRLAGFVLDAFAGEIPVSQIDPDLDLLTKREQQVMRLLARGYTYKQLAERLEISAKTVETHASSVLRKLQLSNRHELTHWAVRRHLI